MLKGYYRIKEKLLSRFFAIPCALSMITIVYVMLNVTYFKTGSAGSATIAILMGLSLCLLIFFVWTLVHLHKVGRQQQLERGLEETQLEYVEKLVEIMEEQRNDILNAISVVTAYLQIGKYDQAQQYLEFIAADQLDKFDYHNKVWLEDPWEAILEHKQEQALLHGILFTVEQKLGPPTDEAKKRLVARLMANLIDDAFQRVLKIKNRHVWLRWYLDDGKPVLEVKSDQQEWDKNSVEPMAAEESCSYSLPDNSFDEYNWRLPICKQIASEVGGALTVTYSGKSTTYRFELQ